MQQQLSFYSYLIISLLVRVMYLQMLFWIIEQAGADAHLEIVAPQNVKMTAALAAFPEFRIVGKLRKRHRAEAEFIIHLHDGGTCGDGEDLGIREFLA